MSYNVYCIYKHRKYNKLYVQCTSVQLNVLYAQYLKISEQFFRVNIAKTCFMLKVILPIIFLSKKLDNK